MLYQLRRSGFCPKDLLRITLVIRPVVEYACPMGHTILPNYLSDTIENIQKRSLRIMHPGLDYETALTVTGIPTLRERSTDICKDYFNKINKNPGHKLHGLLPDTHQLPYKMRDASVSRRRPRHTNIKLL